jgi:glycosyltransferase involved in cell wall biosynthesis
VIPTLARALAANGHQVDLLRVWKEWADVDLGDAGNPVRVVSLGTRRLLPLMPSIARVSSWANYRMQGALMAGAMMPGFVSYLRRERPDFLVARMQTIVAITANAIARGHTKLVLSMAGLPRSSGYRNFLWPRLYPRADAFVAPAQSVATVAAERANMDSERFEVIPNPVISKQVLTLADEPVDHPWFGDSEHPVVVAVGRLTRQKDFPTLVRAMARVREKVPARLLIVGQGEGEHRGLIDSLKVKLGLQDAVQLHGFDPNPYKFMRAADLFVMSSEWEGPGHVLIEAQALGTPIVSTDCPAGPRDTLLDGRAGLLVPVGDSQAVADAIVESLTNRETALQRAQVGIENRDIYFPERVAERWEALFDGVGRRVL